MSHPTLRLLSDQWGALLRSTVGLLSSRPTSLLLSILLGLTLLGAICCSEPPQFDRDVLPILTTHCIDCHGSDEKESNLQLDTMLSALRGGGSGEKVIVPGDSSQSHLLERITSSDSSLRMPPDAPMLSQSQIQTLRDWIDDRPSWQSFQQELTEQRSRHWSYQPLSHSPTPALSLLAPPVACSPIDVFVLNQLASHELAPSEMASREQLIRRLTLVMHGLPPTPEAIDAFINDDRIDAWERLVDRVLASPRMGERWAMHWLDLIRFGETNGFETNRERPHAWPYRDWVVDAINSDKAYDQFVQQQLAGDVLGQPVATGFLVSGPNDIVKGQNALLGLMQRQDELADIVNTTGTAFLGLTIGCARCHNHKFDPITQRDYYAMQAVFAGVEHADRNLPATAAQNIELQAIDQERTRLVEQLQGWTKVDQLREPVNSRENLERFPPVNVRFVKFKIEDTSASEACIDELQIFSADANVALASRGAKVTSSGDFVHPLHKLEHINDGEFGNARSWICSERRGGWVAIELAQTFSIDRIVWSRDREEKYSDRIATAYRIEGSLDGSDWQTLASSSDRRPYKSRSNATEEFDLTHVAASDLKNAQQALAQLKQLTARTKTIRDSMKVYAGTFQSQPAPVHRLFRGDPTAPREAVPPNVVAKLGNIHLDDEAPESARRKAVAQWITDRDNPLTSRVMVNRLWQFHFGTGIVDTPSDFGVSGTLPSHPELLDWLAAELMRGDWSAKRIHRLLLTSHVWQQSSAPNAKALEQDANTRWLWRFPPRRLEAEAIRDSILTVSGQLDLQLGGPGFSAFEVELENVRHYHPKNDFGPADWRRMIYMTKVRQEKDAIFGLFDCPDASQVTPKRSRSTTPLQALNLLNGRFVLQQAEAFATRLKSITPHEHQRIDQAYQLCFGRHVQTDELSPALEFVRQQGWTEFARALLNSNEFVFMP